MELNQLEIKKTILLQDYTIINSSIKEMKLDDIKDNISNLVASNTDLNDSKYIRTEMEEITGYGNTKEMENFLKNHKKELNLTENQLLYINPYDKITEIINETVDKYEFDKRKGNLNQNLSETNLFYKKNQVENNLFKLWKENIETQFEFTPIFDKDEFKLFIDESHVNISDNKIYDLGKKYNIEVITTEIEDIYPSCEKNNIDELKDISFKKGNVEYEIVDYKKLDKKNTISYFALYRHDIDKYNENGAISTLILERKEDTELKNKFSFVDNNLLFPNLIIELENKFPEYKDKIENLLENSDKIEVEFPDINDDFFELEKAYTKEVEVLKKSIKERIYNGVENMGEMVSIVKMNSFLEEQTPLYLQQELQYRTFQTKNLLEKDDSYLLITELKDSMKKHLPDILENVEGIKSINTKTFREKMENILLNKEKENIEEKQKTHFKEKEREKEL